MVDRQVGEGVAGLLQGEADALGGADEGEPAQRGAAVPALAAGGALGLDEAEFLVVPQGGGGQAAAGGQFADAEPVAEVGVMGPRVALDLKCA